MRSSIILPFAAALAVAGCNSGNSDSIEAKNESAEAVAAKVAKTDIRLQPGRWESTLKFERLEIANLPPAAKQAMNEQMGMGQAFATCLTPEDVAKPDASFFQGSEESGCIYENFSMSNGVINASMTCDREGQKQKTVMSGTYGADSYTLKVVSKGESQPGMPTDLSMSIASRRVGACKGDEDS